MAGPFEHLLRNAIAHGLEDPQGRLLEELVADKLEYVRSDSNPLFVAPVVESSDAPAADLPSAS